MGFAIIPQAVILPALLVNQGHASLNLWRTQVPWRGKPTVNVADSELFSKHHEELLKWLLFMT